MVVKNRSTKTHASKLAAKRNQTCATRVPFMGEKEILGHLRRSASSGVKRDFAPLAPLASLAKREGERNTEGGSRERRTCYETKSLP